MSDLLKLMYERQDGLFIAVKCLLSYEWEGSSVNFRARNALNEIRNLGTDNARLIEEAREERQREEVKP
jgi:hypothetical protein